MVTGSVITPLHRPLLGVACMGVGMFAISLNDMTIKALSGDYPLHQIVLLRSLLGLVITAGILQFEGGWRALAVRQPGLHALRAGLIVLANSALYAAIVAMPLATATAIYFLAPLLVTLLAIPVSESGSRACWRWPRGSAACSSSWGRSSEPHRGSAGSSAFRPWRRQAMPACPS
jgi:drug/metabolite transporter (DMT)-like permease